MTNPNVRSEPGADASSRTKLSWVDWVISNLDKTTFDVAAL
jgi:hypothetical protein